MKTVNITLNSPWFELVKKGAKKYEGRRKLPKYASLVEGDVITVSHHTDVTREPYYARVDVVLEFPTFKDALDALPIHEVLPIENITVEQGVEIYHKYVSQATQEKDGIVMIKLVVFTPEC